MKRKNGQTGTVLVEGGKPLYDLVITVVSQAGTSGS